MYLYLLACNLDCAKRCQCNFFNKNFILCFLSDILELGGVPHPVEYAFFCRKAYLHARMISQDKKEFGNFTTYLKK